jgi:hypothetical protein
VVITCDPEVGWVPLHAAFSAPRVALHEFTPVEFQEIVIESPRTIELALELRVNDGVGTLACAVDARPHATNPPNAMMPKSELINRGEILVIDTKKNNNCTYSLQRVHDRILVYVDNL